MDTFRFLFHIAATTDPAFLAADDQTALITMEANRLHWENVPDLYGDKLAFVTGYVMGREGLARDPHMIEGMDRDYDLGFAHGCTVQQGKRRPHWDRIIPQS